MGSEKSQTSQAPHSGAVVSSTTQNLPATLSGTDGSAGDSTGLSTNDKIAIGITVPLGIIAAAIAFSLLWLRRRRTAKQPRNPDNNNLLPEEGYADKPELEASRGIARAVTQKPELEATTNTIETRDILPPAGTTTTTELPPPNQNTSILYLGGGDKPELEGSHGIASLVTQKQELEAN